MAESDLLRDVSPASKPLRRVEPAASLPSFAAAPFLRLGVRVFELDLSVDGFYISVIWCMVMYCNALSCNVMPCHVMSCHVM